MNTEPQSPKETLELRLSAKCTVRLEFTGEVTQEAVLKLAVLLNLTLDFYPPESLEAFYNRPDVQAVMKRAFLG